MPKNYGSPTIERPEAMRLFTDRDDEREVLRQFFASIEGGQALKKHVVHFYGVGGVGKTTLLAKAIQECHDAKPKSPLKIVSLSVDSNDWDQKSSPSSFFVHLRAALGRAGVSAPIFDALHFCLWAKQNPGENCTLKNSPFSDLLSDKLPHGDFLAAVCDQVGAFLGGFNPVTALDKILGKWRESGGLQEFRSVFKKNPAEMLDKDLTCHMPEALAADLRTFLKKNPGNSLCLALDGFERVQSVSAYSADIQNAFQEFVARLVLSRPRRLGFIVLGRERLRWDYLFDDQASSADEQWPSLIAIHLLGGLSREDAFRFLESAREQITDTGVCDILKNHAEAILTVSGDGKPNSPCYPYYLDLALDIVCRTSKFFKLDMLGHQSAELEERLLRYLGTEEKKALQALALAGSFDEILFRDLVERKVIQKYAATEFPSLVGASRSYIDRNPSRLGWHIFHRHMSDALVKNLGKEEDKQIAGRVVTEILESLERRFHVDKLADFTPSHFDLYSQAFRILATHASGTGFLSPDYVRDRYFEWTSLLDTRFHAAKRCDLVQPFIAYFEKSFGLEDSVTIGSLNTLAILLSAKGDLEQAEILFRKILEVRIRTLGLESPDALSSFNNLALVLFDKGDREEAEALCRQALEVMKRTMGSEHPDKLTCLNNLANLLTAKGNLAEAEPLCREALEGRMRLLGSEHSDTLSSLNNLAILLHAKGDLTGAEPFYREALDVMKRTLGPDHSDILAILNNLANLLSAKGDLAGAETFYREALEVMNRILGPEHPTTLAILNNLANLLHAKSDLAGAEPFYRKALEVMNRTLDPDHPTTLAILNNLALLLSDKGDLAGAETFYRKALEVMNRTLGTENPTTLSSLNNLALLLCTNGDLAGAETFYREVLEVRQRTLGRENVQTLSSLNNLGRLLFNTGDLTRAEPFLREALEGMLKLETAGNLPSNMRSVFEWLIDRPRNNS